jgi:hypothetical protein
LILSEGPFLGLGKGYITKEALDTPWCHYQTLAPTQEGEKPAPEAKNDREKGQKGPFKIRHLRSELSRYARALCSPVHLTVRSFRHVLGIQPSYPVSHPLNSAFLVTEVLRRSFAACSARHVLLGWTGAPSRATWMHRSCFTWLRFSPQRWPERAPAPSAPRVPSAWRAPPAHNVSALFQ